MKTLNDYLEGSGLVFAVVTPRQVVKDAFDAKMIDDGQVWIEMLDHRNLLAHAYSFATFDEAVETIHTRYLAAIAELHGVFQQEAMK